MNVSDKAGLRVPRELLLCTRYVCLSLFLVVSAYGQKDDLRKARFSNLVLEAEDSLETANYTAAVSLAEKALEIKPVEDDELILSLFYILTKATYHLGETEQTFHYAMQGHSLASERHNHTRRAYFGNIIGILYRRQGNCDRAIEYYSDAVEVNTRLKDSVNLSRNFNNLSICYQIIGNFGRSVDYLNKAYDIRRSLKDTLGQANVLLNMGNSYEEINNYEKAFEYYLAARDLYLAIGREDMAANSLFNIGLVYHELDNIDNALQYYSEAADIALAAELRELEAYIYQNIGNLYSEIGNPQSALEYQYKALALFRTLGLISSQSDVLLNTGIQYAELAKPDSAMYYFQQSLETSSDYAPDVFIEMGKVQLSLSAYRRAEMYFLQALTEARERQDLYLQAESLRALYELYKNMGRTGQALENYEAYTAIRDSLDAVEQENNIAKFKLQYDFEKQEAEIALLNKENQLQIARADKARTQNKLMLYIMIFLLLGLSGLIYLFSFIHRKNKQISLERDRSEALLRNILPVETAEELKKYGSVQAQRHDPATVMFTDFVNFTNYAEEVTPEDVVKSIDYYFRKFDEIIENHGLEKIKTIGDAYMCAAGLPVAGNRPEERIIKASIDILNFVKETRIRPPAGIHTFDIRIGINTGPIVAGVVGTHKFQFDIWGDAVNIASRMESACEPGRINVSEATYKKVNEQFDFEYRGEIMMKSKGLMKMYYLKT